MAHYDVTYTCGHTEEIQLFGKQDDRYRRIEWLQKNRMCNSCFQAQKQKEYEEQSRVAAEIAKSQKLPDLEGSEKQIVWAESIRKETLESKNNTILPLEQLPFDKNKEPQKYQLYKIAQEARKKLESETSAKWWIDNRYTANEMVKRSVREAEMKARGWH